VEPAVSAMPPQIAVDKTAIVDVVNIKRTTEQFAVLGIKGWFVPSGLLYGFMRTSLDERKGLCRACTHISPVSITEHVARSYHVHFSSIQRSVSTLVRPPGLVLKKLVAIDPKTPRFLTILHQRMLCVIASNNAEPNRSVNSTQLWSVLQLPSSPQNV